MTDKYAPGLFSGILPGRGVVAGLLVVTIITVAIVLAVSQFTADDGSAGSDSAAAPVDTAALVLSGRAGDPGSGSAVVDEDVIRLSVEGLDPTRAGEHYALWLANSDDDLLPLAAFRAGESGEAEVSVPLPGAPADYRRLEISREPDDGDPTRSGPVVLSAPTR
mgnify:CR=1 FL=1